MRHFYEVIPKDYPCKLYFDLEFSKCANPQVNYDLVETELMTPFVELVCSQLEKLYGLTDISRKTVLDLDSSTETKFSRHLIFTEVVFRSNFHAGLFVRHLCKVIEEMVQRTSSSPLPEETSAETEMKSSAPGDKDQVNFSPRTKFHFYKIENGGDRRRTEDVFVDKVRSKR